MASTLRLYFRVFSESARPISALMDDIDAEAQGALRNRTVRAKHVALRSAAVVVLSGFLESFLRQCAESFFEDLSRRGLVFAELPVEMRNIHYVAGIEEAQRIAKRDRKVDSAYAETRAALSRLADPATKNAPSLFWQAFAATRGNPGPDVIADFLRNFGVRSPLKVVAAESGMTEGYLRLSLDSFIRLRNECAHTGTAKATPLPSEVREFVELLRRLTLGITKVLDRRLADLYAKVVAERGKSAA